MKILIIGSSGEFGAHLVSEFSKLKDITILSIDRIKNSEIVNSFTFDDDIPFTQIDLIINCSGAFKSDSYRSKNLIENYNSLFDANVKTSLWATKMISKLRQDGSLFILIGSAVSLEEKPKMLTYSLAKKTVINLIKLLSNDDDLLGTSFLLLLPSTLKTISNEKYFKEDDMIPLEDISSIIIKILFSNNVERPPSGTMLEIQRKEGKTVISNK